MEKRISIAIRGPLLGQSAVCEPILRALPDWFGIEEATAQYVRDTDVMPTLIAAVEDQALGFLTLRRHNPYTAEIHVMGVRPEWHGQGVGRALVEKAAQVLREDGVEYLQVKTLSDSHPDPGYARTRAFYLAMGFRPLEEFKTLWGETNPCLLMVKYLWAQPLFRGDNLSNLL